MLERFTFQNKPDCNTVKQNLNKSFLYPLRRSEVRGQTLIGQAHTLFQSPDERCTRGTEKRCLHKYQNKKMERKR